MRDQETTRVAARASSRPHTAVVADQGYSFQRALTQTQPAQRKYNAVPEVPTLLATWYASSRSCNLRSCTVLIYTADRVHSSRFNIPDAVVKSAQATLISSAQIGSHMVVWSRHVSRCERFRHPSSAFPSDLTRSR